MKNISLLLILLSVSFNSFSQVKISGKVIHPPKNAKVSISYYDNKILTNRIDAGSTQLDGKGNFQISFDLNQSVEGELIIDNQMTMLYLVPGDSLFVTMDFNNFDSTLSYSGKGAADNNYMAKEFFLGLQNLSSSYSKFSDEVLFTNFIDSVENMNHQFFNSNRSDNFTTEFNKYIIAKNKYRFIDGRYLFSLKIDIQSMSVSEKIVSAHYFDFIDKIDFNDQDAVNVTEYQVALIRYFYQKHDGKTRSLFSDTLPEAERNKLIFANNYNYRKSVTKGKVLDRVLSEKMIDIIEELIDETAFVDSIMNDFRSSCKNPDYINEINQNYKIACALKKGLAAPDFTLVDDKGEKISLSSFKDKVVYIDFWATHCVPCLGQMPKSKVLMEKFKDNPDVAFIFVNVKDNMNTWKNYISKNKSKGQQLFANKSESKILETNFNFDGIPHYVLINKDGTIIDSDAETPGLIEPQIRLLLQQ